jgi:CRP-like cAMP-binding protein
MPLEDSAGRALLFADLPTDARERVASVLAATETAEIAAGASTFASSFPSDALLLLEDGFVVVRATFSGVSRAVITCEAGPGKLLLPPAAEEQLVALTASRVAVIPAASRDRLVEIPSAADRIIEVLSVTLAQKQEAISNFAAPQHVARVRRKLLQLARSYGHVVRDGIRIDFPVSHAVLAEMVGSSRETVTRALDELQRARFVARTGSTYRLLTSPEAVIRIA